MSLTITNHAASFGLVDSEMLAFKAGVRRTQQHAQTPMSLWLERRVNDEKPKPFITAEFLLDDWTDAASPKPFAITIDDGKETVCLTSTDATSLSSAFWNHLERAVTSGSLCVVWNGKGLVFHAILRHLARCLSLIGVKVQPLVSGSDVKAIILTRGAYSLTLCSLHAMTGISSIDQEALCGLFGACSHPGLTRSRRLWNAVTAFCGLLRSHFGASLRPTIAAVSIAAARLWLPEDAKWYRPRLALEAVCRYAGAYRGGYVYSERFQGKAWRIDVNKLYTSLLRHPLPAGSTLAHAGEQGREHPGIYLCRIEGKGHFPSYISAFSLHDMRFHKQRSTTPSFWTWLPSAEFVGLRALGYQVIAGLGFRFDRWVSLKPFAEQLIHHISSPSASPGLVMLCKMLGNSLTGKLGQSPEHLNVCYSIAPPGKGWVPFLTAEQEEVEGLWVKRDVHFAGYQHVDAAAWVTAQGRGKMYGQLARIQALGWRSVYVDTDGLILDQDPRGILALSAATPGQWRYDGYDPECIVAKGKWYSFNGEVHTSGATGITREHLEAVHYGKQVVVSRKVLSPALASGPSIVDSHITLGGR